MTLPDERFRAVINTREFLRALLDPKKTPRIPKSIRKEAYALLKHYPAFYELAKVAHDLSKVFSMPTDLGDEYYGR